MDDLLNDIELDNVIGGLQDGLTYCSMGTAQGGGPGVYGAGAECSSSYATWMHDQMQAHGLIPKGK
jgi:hypothetical protein